MIMNWVPSWLAKLYAILYLDKEKEVFDNDDAKKILHIYANDVLSLRLTKLEDAGFLISKRDSVDRRKKYFRLIEPNDAIFAFGIKTLASSDEVLDRLVIASKRMDVVVGGAQAAYVHSGYASPGKIDLYVNEKNIDKWISLMADKFTSVSIDETLAEKTARTNVHIHSTLTKDMIDASIKLEGIRYESPESIIISGFVEQSEFSLTDAISILIQKRKELDFKKILELTKAENCERELGMCMELINFESKRKIFNNELINKFYTSIDLSRKKFFPRNKIKESIEYKALSEKWRLKICISRAFVSKIITDLVR